MRIKLVILFCFVFLNLLLAASTCQSNLQINQVAVGSSAALKVTLTYFDGAGGSFPIVGAPITFSGNGFATTATTDTSGQATVNPPPAGNACNIIQVSYAGSSAITPACSGISSSQVNYNLCPPGQVAILSGTSALCLPVMLLLAVLLGSMFLIGKNPLASFDFGSPRFSRGQMRSFGQQYKQKITVASVIGAVAQHAARLVQAAMAAKGGAMAGKVAKATSKAQGAVAKASQAAARGKAMAPAGRVNTTVTTGGTRGPVQAARVTIKSPTAQAIRAKAMSEGRKAFGEAMGAAAKGWLSGFSPKNLLRSFALSTPLGRVYSLGTGLRDTFRALPKQNAAMQRNYESAMNSQTIVNGQFLAALTDYAGKNGISQGDLDRVMARIYNPTTGQVNIKELMAAFGDLKLTPAQQKELAPILVKVALAQANVNRTLLAQVGSVSGDLRNKELAAIQATVLGKFVDNAGNIKGTGTGDHDDNPINIKDPSAGDRLRALYTQAQDPNSAASKHLKDTNQELFAAVTGPAGLDQTHFNTAVGEFTTVVSSHLSALNQLQSISTGVDSSTQRNAQDVAANLHIAPTGIDANGNIPGTGTGKKDENPINIKSQDFESRLADLYFQVHDNPTGKIAKNLDANNHDLYVSLRGMNTEQFTATFVTGPEVGLSAAVNSRSQELAGYLNQHLGQIPQVPSTQQSSRDFYQSMVGTTPLRQEEKEVQQQLREMQQQLKGADESSRMMLGFQIQGAESNLDRLRALDFLLTHPNITTQSDNFETARRNLADLYQNHPDEAARARLGVLQEKYERGEIPPAEMEGVRKQLEGLTQAVGTLPAGSQQVVSSCADAERRYASQSEQFDRELTSGISGLPPGVQAKVHELINEHGANATLAMVRPEIAAANAALAQVFQSNDPSLIATVAPYAANLRISEIDAETALSGHDAAGLVKAAAGIQANATNILTALNPDEDVRRVLADKAISEFYGTMAHDIASITGGGAGGGGVGGGHPIFGPGGRIIGWQP